MQQAARTNPATGSKLTHALVYADRGLRVFPTEAGTKIPRIDAWQKKATRDPEQIKAWWSCPVMRAEQPHNIGICTTDYFDGKRSRPLLVLDIDRKNGKDGLAELRKLATPHGGLPETLTAKTPSGGLHLYFTCPRAVGNSNSKLAPGIDIKGHGGYVLAPGSTTDTGAYDWLNPGAPIAEAPAWLVELCSAPVEKKEPRPGATVAHIDAPRARKRAVEYLKDHAPLAVEGSGGDQITYSVSARLKDFGVSQAGALTLLLEHWNERCSPPWQIDDLAEKVANAYRYGKAEPGAAAPEVQFSEVAIDGNATNTEHPFAKLNREHAFVMIKGGHAILHETTDARGNPAIDLLKESSFHKKHAAWMMQTGKTTRPVTQLWMEHPSRRSYAGLCFMPGQEAAPNYYNLFRGFTVKPASAGTHRALAALDAWKEHLFENVARGNDEHARWITGWFAHLVQRPHEKPLVALALYGGKGVGKNCLVERVCDLLGAHAMITADSRYVVGNFNSHLEHCLLLGMDETFWAGDRHMEGKLKALVTGKEHIIERKGFEPYPAENLTRVVILGNNEHLVPASHDERRYAVFHVGDGRKQDRAFFQGMKAGMEAGGSGLLLHYLQTFDLNTVDVNQAPSTEALTENKLASLPSAARWLAESLIEGTWLGNDFGDVAWPKTSNKAGLYAAYKRWSKDRHDYRPEDIRTWSRALRTILGECVRDYRPSGQERCLMFSDLDACRDRLRAHLGGSWDSK